jgi:hypothetical protein
MFCKGAKYSRHLSEQDYGNRIGFPIRTGSDRRVLDAADRLGRARGLNIVGTLSKPIRLAALREVLTRLV